MTCSTQNKFKLALIRSWRQPAASQSRSDSPVSNRRRPDRIQQAVSSRRINGCNRKAPKPLAAQTQNSCVSPPHTHTHSQIFLLYPIREDRNNTSEASAAQVPTLKRSHRQAGWWINESISQRTYCEHSFIQGRNKLIALPESPNDDAIPFR